MMLLAPRALSMACGCIMTSAALSLNFSFATGYSVLAAPAMCVGCLLLLLSALTAVLVSGDAINSLKSIFTYAEFEGGQRESAGPQAASAQKQAIKEVKLELYENMMSQANQAKLEEEKDPEPLATPKSTSLDNPKAHLNPGEISPISGLTPTTPFTTQKIGSNGSESTPEAKAEVVPGTPKEVNVEVLMSDSNQPEDGPSVPKNLTFRSMLSSKLDTPADKDFDDSLSSSKEKQRDLPLVQPRGSLVEQKLIDAKESSSPPKNTVSSNHGSPERIAMVGDKATSQDESTHSLETAVLVLITIQDSVLGDLWPLWLGVCVGARQAERYIGLVFAVAFGALAIVQCLSLCKCRSAFVRPTCARALLFLLVPAYVGTAFVPSLSADTLAAMLAFVSLCCYERFALFLANSFVMNRLPKNSQLLYKCRYAVRLFAYLGGVLLFAGGKEGPLLDERVVFLVLATMGSGTAICMLLVKSGGGMRPLAIDVGTSQGQKTVTAVMIKEKDKERAELNPGSSESANQRVS